MADPETTTLYVRGVPRSVVRKAKAAAAREGRTLGDWVTAQLARCTGSHAFADGVNDIRDDLDWYESNKSRLQRKYPSEYVAIVDGRVVDHDPSFEALAGRMFERFGTRSICMPRLDRDVVQVRSPRRASG